MEKSIPYTVEELRVLSKPYTWFRKELIERSENEFEENPSLRWMLSDIHEQLMCREDDYQKRLLSEKEIMRIRKKTRKDIGNILYV